DIELKMAFVLSCLGLPYFTVSQVHRFTFKIHPSTQISYLASGMCMYVCVCVCACVCVLERSLTAQLHQLLSKTHTHAHTHTQTVTHTRIYLLIINSYTFSNMPYIS